MSEITPWKWRRAVAQSALESGCKLVCFALANYLPNRGGCCFPSIATLARDTSLTTRSVMRHLKTTEQAGFIRREHGALHNRYYAELPVTSCPAAGDKNDSRVVTPCHPNSIENSFSNSVTEVEEGPVEERKAQLLAALEQELKPAVVAAWFGKMHFRSVEEGVITLAMPSSFARDYAAQHFHYALNNAVARLWPKHRWQLV